MLHASNTVRAVTLEWDRNAEPNVAGYRLLYGHVPGEYDQQLDAGNSTTATVTDLQPGWTYWFVVVAYNSLGMESDPSNVVTYDVPPPPPTAAVLLDFTAVWQADGGLRLAWNTGVEVGVIGFLVQRQDVEGQWNAVSDPFVPALNRGVPTTYAIVDPDPPRSSRPSYRLLAVDIRGAASVLAETPRFPAPELRLKSTDTGFLLSASSGEGGRYLVEAAIDLTTCTWDPLCELSLTPWQTTSIALPRKSRHRFFRLRNSQP